ncbi:MAG: hypothetical protein JO317_05960, partial [Verrucomicrobiae bacterium]|nr:hypothetical protein [Verrucomicrobiae bacterium]
NFTLWDPPSHFYVASHGDGGNIVYVDGRVKFTTTFETGPNGAQGNLQPP